MRRISVLNGKPLVDVLLVLLIVFMAALPLNEREELASLPAAVQRTLHTDATRIVAELSADRTLTVNHQRVALERAEAFFRDVFSARSDRTLYVAGAGSLRYGEVMYVINAARSAGVTKVGIVTTGMREGR